MSVKVIHAYKRVFNVKLEVTGVYLFFLFFIQNIDCEYSLKSPHGGGSKMYHNQCFDYRYGKKKQFD